MARTLPLQPRVLVVGSGAREHTLAWKLAQSPQRAIIFAAPGNPGMTSFCELVNIADSDVNALVAYAQGHEIDFVIVGPEKPLSLGLIDALEQVGIPAFGPAQAAAQLEASKGFAKELMAQAEVPTAAYRIFSDAESAHQYIDEIGAPIVVKADGLAAGKGVTVAMTNAEAHHAVDEALVDFRFGKSGGSVVIESFLVGTEVSLMFFVDAHTVRPMLSARDHKRVFDNDEGPNTGGMGAFAPVPGFEAAKFPDMVLQRIVQPTLSTLKTRGITYRGVLYVGLMMTAEGPSVVEFNARFGDPETEVVLPLLETDFLALTWAVATDTLSEVPVVWSANEAVCVVVAAPGYPESPQTGDSIIIADKAHPHVQVFHAGTKFADDQTLVTNGGRVLAITAVAPTFAEAREAAYAKVQSVNFEGKHYRTDIGLRRQQ